VLSAERYFSKINLAIEQSVDELEVMRVHGRACCRPLPVCKQDASTDPARVAEASCRRLPVCNILISTGIRFRLDRNFSRL